MAEADQEEAALRLQESLNAIPPTEFPEEDDDVKNDDGGGRAVADSAPPGRLAASQRHPRRGTQLYTEALEPPQSSLNAAPTVGERSNGHDDHHQKSRSSLADGELVQLRRAMVEQRLVHQTAIDDHSREKNRLEAEVTRLRTTVAAQQAQIDAQRHATATVASSSRQPSPQGQEYHRNGLGDATELDGLRAENRRLREEVAAALDTRVAHLQEPRVSLEQHLALAATTRTVLGLLRGQHPASAEAELADADRRLALSDAIAPLPSSLSAPVTSSHANAVVGVAATASHTPDTHVAGGQHPQQTDRSFTLPPRGSSSRGDSPGPHMPSPSSFAGVSAHKRSLSGLPFTASSLRGEGAATTAADRSIDSARSFSAAGATLSYQKNQSSSRGVSGPQTDSQHHHHDDGSLSAPGRTGEYFTHAHAHSSATDVTESLVEGGKLLKIIRAVSTTFATAPSGGGASFAPANRAHGSRSSATAGTDSPLSLLRDSPGASTARLATHNTAASIAGTPAGSGSSGGTMKEWAFRNATSDLQFVLEFTFGPLSHVVPLGDTTPVTATVASEGGGKAFRVSLYPGETKPFVRGVVNGYRMKIQYGPPDSGFTPSSSVTDGALRPLVERVAGLGAALGGSPERIARECATQGLPFVDTDFPPLSASMARGFEGPGPVVHWEKPSALVPAGEQPELCGAGLLHDTPVGGGGPVGGNLRDGWLTTAMQILAACRPALVRQCFATSTEGSQLAGLYRVTLCLGGWWTDIAIDGYLPCVPKTFLPFGSRCLSARDLWAPLLEKSMAKALGSYAALRSGDALDALADLTGAPTQRVDWRARDGAAFHALRKAHPSNVCVALTAPKDKDRQLRSSSSSSGQRGAAAEGGDILIRGNASSQSLLAASGVLDDEAGALTTTTTSKDKSGSTEGEKNALSFEEDGGSSLTVGTSAATTSAFAPGCGFEIVSVVAIQDMRLCLLRTLPGGAACWGGIWAAGSEMWGRYPAAKAACDEAVQRLLEPLGGGGGGGGSTNRTSAASPPVGMGGAVVGGGSPQGLVASGGGGNGTRRGGGGGHSRTGSANTSAYRSDLSMTTSGANLPAVAAGTDNADNEEGSGSGSGSGSRCMAKEAATHGLVWLDWREVTSAFVCAGVCHLRCSPWTDVRIPNVFEHGNATTTAGNGAPRWILEVEVLQPTEMVVGLHQRDRRQAAPGSADRTYGALLLTAVGVSGSGVWDAVGQSHRGTFWRGRDVHLDLTLTAGPAAKRSTYIVPRRYAEDRPRDVVVSVRIQHPGAVRLTLRRPTEAVMNSVRYSPVWKFDPAPCEEVDVPPEGIQVNGSPTDSLALPCALDTTSRVEASSEM